VIRLRAELKAASGQTPRVPGFRCSRLFALGPVLGCSRPVLAAGAMWPVLGCSRPVQCGQPPRGMRSRAELNKRPPGFPRECRRKDTFNPPKVSSKPRMCDRMARSRVGPESRPGSRGEGSAAGGGGKAREQRPDSGCGYGCRAAGRCSVAAEIGRYCGFGTERPEVKAGAKVPDGPELAAGVG
jgi:hypothetical protein